MWGGKVKKSYLLIIILMLLLPLLTVNAKYELERQDIYDYKEFFDDLYPIEEDSKPNSCLNIGSVSGSCSGVTVNGYGTYPLDEYVAGVLAAEFAGTNKNEELGKAFSIVIRTYTMSHTSDCKNSIGSSSAEQNFAQESTGVVDTETYRKYADATSGIVMVNSEGYANGTYSLAKASDCEPAGNGMCKFRRCTLWADPLSSCKGKITEFIVPDDLITYSGSVHYGGIEPYIAVYYAEHNGYTYDKLLKAFYGDDISLAYLSGSKKSSGSSDKKTTSSEKNANDSSKETSSSENGIGGSNLSCDPDGDYVSVDNVKFKFMNYNIEGTSDGLGSSFDLTAGYVSQCPWYAKYRAIEIVESSNLSSDLKSKAKSALLATNGNGNMWYAGTNSTLSYFQYSNDVNKPKPGSIVAWERNTHNYGHVGIVEKVNADGSVVISEGWNMGGPNGADIPSNIKIITHTMSIEEVRTYGGTGSFIGYTYLFSYKK